MLSKYPIDCYRGSLTEHLHILGIPSCAVQSLLISQRAGRMSGSVDRDKVQILFVKLIFFWYGVLGNSLTSWDPNPLPQVVKKAP